jgi:hypothetical protein
VPSESELRALFARKPSGLEIVGPFEEYRVLLHGHEVPFVYALPRAGGGLHINLDNRFGLDLTMEEAERFLPFLADTIAVALGFTCHPAPECPEPRARSPFPHSVGIASTEVG